MSFCMWSAQEKFKDHFEPGVYICAQCGCDLFLGKSKYEHHSPWPSFNDAVSPTCLHKRPEDNTGLVLKISCAKCMQGLGHEFVGDGPQGSSRF